MPTALSPELLHQHRPSRGRRDSEVARRWLEFCQEHNIGQSAASGYLARAKGHHMA